MDVKSYRKKPVAIEAMQYDGTNGFAIYEWMQGVHTITDERTSLMIETLEGTMRAAIGDFIIRGIRGEFCPCKPDIFSETYEEVT